MSRKILISICGFFMVIAVIAAISCSKSVEEINADGTNQSNLKVEAQWAGGHDSLQSLYSDPDVDLIVVGEIDRVVEVGIIKSTETRWGTINLYYTDFSFMIRSVLKGKNVEEALIHQVGHDENDEFPEFPLFEAGEECVLFLHEFEPGKYYVVGGAQGRYKIVEGNVYSLNYILSLLPSDSYSVPEGLYINGVPENDFTETITGIASSIN